MRTSTRDAAMPTTWGRTHYAPHENRTLSRTVGPGTGEILLLDHSFSRELQQERSMYAGEGRIVHLFASATTLPVSEHRADPTTCTAPGQARCISCSLSGGDTRIERVRLSSCVRSRLLCWCCSRDPAVDPEIIFRDSLISVKTEGVISIS